MACETDLACLMLTKYSSPKGTTVVSSSSILFCPEDITLPVYKIPLSEVKLAKVSNSWTHKAGLSKKLTALRIKLDKILCKKGHQEFTTETEHQNVYTSKGIIIGIIAAERDAVLQHIEALRQMQSLSQGDRENKLQQLIAQVEAKKAANTKWLPSGERIVSTNHVTLFAHFERIRGNITITNENLYFVPYDVCKPEPPFHKISLSGIKNVLKQRFLNTETALEILLFGNTSLFIVLDSQSTRDNLYTRLGVKADPDVIIAEAKKGWENGEISNFDYLTVLNRMAGRTTNEPSLYPIFPWVIADYDSQSLDLTDPKIYRDFSKPIGALNANKLEKLKENMAKNNYLYPKLYSNPEDVTSLLSRVYPDKILQMKQSFGNQAINLFAHLPESFNGVLTSPDINFELTPEFYERDGQFLINSKSWKLGTTNVPNVTLPKWASSAADFVRINRLALESDYVTAHLHEWIDLVFGYKNPKTSAHQYDNLYNNLCYQPCTALTHGHIFSQDQKNIYLCGQIPRQLFSEPHPTKTHSQARVLQERDTLKNELAREREERSTILRELEERCAELLSEKEALENRTKELLSAKDRDIAQLSEHINGMESENRELRDSVDNMEKKTSVLSRKMASRSPTNRRPNDVKYVNKYILQLENDLLASRKDEQMRVKELEQTHKLLLEYKAKLENQKEISDRYYQKMLDLKKIRGQINELTLEVNQLKASNEEKEKTIHKYLRAHNEKDEELRHLRLDNHNLAHQIKGLELLMKDEFKMANQSKIMKFLDISHARIKTSFLPEDEIEVDEEEVSKLSLNVSKLSESVPLSQTHDLTSINMSLNATMDSAELLEDSQCDVDPEEGDERDESCGEQDEEQLLLGGDRTNIETAN